MSEGLMSQNGPENLGLAHLEAMNPHGELSRIEPLAAPLLIDGLTLTEIAFQTFFAPYQKSSNGLGNIAYIGNKAGALYKRATGHPAYYPGRGDVEILERNADVIAHNVGDVDTVCVIGQGPQDIFSKKELMLIRRMPSVKKIVTVDFSERFNNEAKDAVNKLSAELGCEIIHDSFTGDYKDPSAQISIRAKLLSTSSQASILVMSTGGLITNIETNDHSVFPIEQLSKDLGSMANIAGPCGKIMVTYDSNEDEPTLVGAYDTEEMRTFFLNSINNISRECKDVTGLQPRNFTVRSVWNKQAQAVDHKLVVRREKLICIRHSGQTSSKMLQREDLFYIISSYKPSVGTMTEAGNAARVKTLLSLEDDRGPTVHLFNNRCARPSAYSYGK